MIMFFLLKTTIYYCNRKCIQMPPTFLNRFLLIIGSYRCLSADWLIRAMYLIEVEGALYRAPIVVHASLLYAV